MVAVFDSIPRVDPAAEPVRRETPSGLEPSLHRLDVARRSGDHNRIRRCESVVVQQYRPLADRIARRYRGRGVEDDDLIQLARFGLFKAVRRWRPQRGATLVQFAAPTIEGEIKRYFRDHCRPIRMPRGIADDQAVNREIEEALTHRLSRRPTEHEVASCAGSSVDRVRQQRWAAAVCQPVSADSSPALVGTVRCEVTARTMDDLDDLLTLGAAIRKLPLRERRVLALRFMGDLSQTQIARRLGVSQMHVSRMLRSTLDLLRAQVA